MTLAKVDFATYVSWSEKERQEYSAAWMYIHNKGKNKKELENNHAGSDNHNPKL